MCIGQDFEDGGEVAFFMCIGLANGSPLLYGRMYRYDVYVFLWNRGAAQCKLLHADGRFWKFLVLFVLLLFVVEMSGHRFNSWFNKKNNHKTQKNQKIISFCRDWSMGLQESLSWSHLHQRCHTVLMRQQWKTRSWIYWGSSRKGVITCITA